MWLLRERSSDFRESNLQTVQEWTKSYIELIALYVHPKNSNHLRSHLRAIKALDHSRLGLENKFLENKAGQNFCVRQVYLTKSCQQIRGRVNQPFILSIHYNWNAVFCFVLFFVFCFFFIQTSERMQYFTIVQYKLYLFNIQDDRSTRGILAKPLKKISKITYTASRFSLLTSAKFAVRAVTTNRVTLQNNIEFIMFIFYLMVL